MSPIVYRMSVLFGRILADVPIGILPDQVYHDGTATIEPGDVFVIYSDGLLDARQDMFETPARLAAQIAGVRGAPAIVQRVMELAMSEGPLPDDLTIAVLSRSIS